MELKTENSELTLMQVEQGEVLESSATELASIQDRLKTYRETTQQKEDQSKFAKAVSNVHQAADLTELTMLALKINEAIQQA